MLSSPSVIVAAAILALLASAFPVTASACTIAASGFSFGSYDVFSPAPTTTTGSMTITCRSVTIDTPVEVMLSPGTSGNPMRRTMLRRNGITGDALFYNMYFQGSNVPFGDKLGGVAYNALAPRGTPLFSSRIMLQGVIPPHQDVSVNAYQDDLFIELNF